MACTSDFLAITLKSHAYFAYSYAKNEKNLYICAAAGIKNPWRYEAVSGNIVLANCQWPVYTVLSCNKKDQ